MMKKLFSLVLCLCLLLSVTVGMAEEWDAAYDVVVIGFGGAGASAAIEAADAGAKALYAQSLNLLDELLGVAVYLTVCECYVCASLGELDRNGAADTSCGSCYKSCLSFK